MNILVKHIDGFEARAEGYKTVAEGSYAEAEGSRTTLERNTAFIFLFALLTSVAMFMFSNVYAQETVQHEVIDSVELNQAELDQILAPIALYPDSLLSQILVASTYPLEVVQATRWRQANPNLNESQVLSAVENNDWDPSVKALAPYEDLLVQITEDLDWLQNIGDAFLQNEDQVLASVQNLRQKAYDNGTFADNDYYEVSSEGNNIIIESTQREIVYVPYYDTRVAYGNWWWNGYGPTYWHRPRNYVHLSGGFYWNSSFYIRPNIFFGGFHWGSRSLVVNHHYYDNFYGYNGYDRNINISNYRRWTHNPVHRRGVRYPQKVVKSYAPNNQTRSASVIARTNRSATADSNARNASVNSVQQKLNTIKRTTRNTGVTSQRQPAVVNNGNTQRSVTRPTTTNRATVNRSIGNRTIINRTTAPNRSSSTAVTRNQRSTTLSRQPAVNQKSYSRTGSTTKSSTAKTYSKPSTKSTSVNRTATTTTATTTSNRGKWSR